MCPSRVSCCRKYPHVAHNKSPSCGVPGLKLGCVAGAKREGRGGLGSVISHFPSRLAPAMQVTLK